jgi:hypothetical protein
MGLGRQRGWKFYIPLPSKQMPGQEKSNLVSNLEGVFGVKCTRGFPLSDTVYGL